jgi:N-acyl-D-amino-acid deacylase
MDVTPIIVLVSVVEWDLLIENGLIVDGLGSKPFKGFLGVDGGRIVYLSDVKPKVDAKRVIDASGLIVSPGFIDIHSHGDETILLYPKAENYIFQGVTTIVGGNCGFSPAPVGNFWVMSFWEMDWWHELKPYKYYAPLMHPIDKVNEKLREKFGFTIDWRSFNDFLCKVEGRGSSINYIPLVGHGSIRAAVMGEDHKRRASDKEIEEMKNYLREALDSGAHGMSTGLDYAPGFYADTNEIIELVKVVREYGGIYATHWRRTGIRTETRRETKPPEKIKGIVEAIEISEKTGVPVQISHISYGFVAYPPPPERLRRAMAETTLDYVDEAIKRGVDVSFDVIPNITGGVFSMPKLIALLSPWIRESGGIERLIENLKCEDYRRDIKDAIYGGKWYTVNPNLDPYWMDNIVIRKCKNPEYLGKTLGEIASSKGADPVDVLMDMVLEDPETLYEPKYTYAGEESLEVFFKHPRAMVGADIFALDFKWEAKTPPYYLPHPNTYGAFPMFIAKFVREKGVLSLEEAIMKITSKPAERMKINDRGVLKVGAWADITIFNLNRIGYRGTYLEPRVPPDGIEYVIVNGEIVLDRGKHTGALSGKVIRKRRAGK